MPRNCLFTFVDPPLTMASVDENCERLPPLHMNSFTVDDLARDDVPPGALRAYQPAAGQPMSVMPLIATENGEPLKPTIRASKSLLARFFASAE